VRSRLVAATAAAVLITASPLLAQWPAHPSTSVPLKADGTPNLEAPTPRTPENERDVAHMVGK
jgi:hypothetical protein